MALPSIKVEQDEFLPGSTKNGIGPSLAPESAIRKAMKRNTDIEVGDDDVHDRVVKKKRKKKKVDLEGMNQAHLTNEGINPGMKSQPYLELLENGLKPEDNDEDLDSSEDAKISPKKKKKKKSRRKSEAFNQIEQDEFLPRSTKNGIGPSLPPEHAIRKMMKRKIDIEICNDDVQDKVVKKKRKKKKVDLEGMTLEHLKNEEINPGMKSPPYLDLLGNGLKQEDNYADLGCSKDKKISPKKKKKKKSKSKRKSEVVAESIFSSNKSQNIDDQISDILPDVEYSIALKKRKKKDKKKKKQSKRVKEIVIGQEMTKDSHKKDSKEELHSKISKIMVKQEPVSSNSNESTIEPGGLSMVKEDFCTDDNPKEVEKNRDHAGFFKKKSKKRKKSKHKGKDKEVHPFTQSVMIKEEPECEMTELIEDNGMDSLLNNESNIGGDHKEYGSSKSDVDYSDGIENRKKLKKSKNKKKSKANDQLDNAYNIENQSEDSSDSFDLKLDFDVYVSLSDCENAKSKRSKSNNLSKNQKMGASNEDLNGSIEKVPITGSEVFPNLLDTVKTLPSLSRKFKHVEKSKKVKKKKYANDDSKTEDRRLPVHELQLKWKLTANDKEKLKKEGIVLEVGLWRKEELQILDENIKTASNRVGMDFDEFIAFLLDKDAKVQRSELGIYNILLQGIKRSISNLHSKLQRMYDPNHLKGDWSADEEKQLLKLYKKYGNQWSKIGEEIGRSKFSVCHKIRRLVNLNSDQGGRKATNVIHGKWQDDEVNRLIKAVKQYSENPTQNGSQNDISWTKVASEVGTRTVDSCRDKWLFYLALQNQEGERLRWSPKNDEALFKSLWSCQAIHQKYVDWGKVAADLELSVSSQYLKKRWTFLKRKVNGFKSLEFREQLSALSKQFL